MSDLQKYLNNNKIQVTFVHLEMGKMCVADISFLPREGELIRLNHKCFQVDRIMYAYQGSEDTGLTPYPLEPTIFITDATEEQATKYKLADDYELDREDWIGHLREK